jgi:thiol-disulfide isomerase/thioredoxin
MAPLEIALYVGIALVLLWVMYRVYLSLSIGSEGFANAAAAAPAAAPAATLTMYYADWCGHCQTTKPEFAKLGSTQTIGGKQVLIKMVNPEENPDAAKDVDIRGFPTILLSVGSKTVEYPGERTAAAMIEFLKQNVQ